MTGRNTSRPHRMKKKKKTGHLYISTLNSQDTLSPCIGDHNANRISQHFKSPFFQDMFYISLLVRTQRNHIGTDDCYPAEPGTFKLPMVRKYFLPKDLPSEQKNHLLGKQLGDVEWRLVEAFYPVWYTEQRLPLRLFPCEGSKHQPWASIGYDE